MKNGYLFFTNYSNTHSKNIYLSRNSVSIKLKDICKRVNLYDPYYKRRNGQKQGRITPHTFRAFFIWRVSETSSMRMAQMLVGHESINQTAKYVNALALADRQDKVIENAFDF